ncbi:hypothetical protein [Hymenobacter sp. 102]|uniref:hypothetical protein n=1 Tax=Hymenobacter sp. 102 TaxID=3403152 RepID=UPI003CF8CDBF
MAQLHFTRRLSDNLLQQTLQMALPQLRVFPWALLLGEEPMEFNSGNPAHVFFEVTESGIPHYTQQLNLYRTPESDWEERALWLGQLLSVSCNVEVLVPFTHPEKPDNPFYNIVFRNGESYLADDSQTEFGEPDAKPVRVLGPYILPPVQFDGAGNRR